MNRTITTAALLSAAAFLFGGCWGSRFTSADKDLEAVYMGKSYYEVVDEFGRPDYTSKDDEGGTIAVYDETTLNGTSASSLYRKYVVRNKRTHEEGAPNGAIVFSFNARMRCYAVQSDFQRRDPDPTPSEDDGRKGVRQFVKPRVPRTIDFPHVDRRSPYAQVVSIERVEVERDKTKVYFSYCDRTPDHRPIYDKGLAINPDIFLRDCETGKRMKLVETEGITVYPQYTDFAHNRGGFDMLVYSVTFEPIPLNTITVDIIEPGPEGFNFYGVDVRTPMNFVQSKHVNPIH